MNNISWDLSSLDEYYSRTEDATLFFLESGGNYNNSTPILVTIGSRRMRYKHTGVAQTPPSGEDDDFRPISGPVPPTGAFR